MSVSLRSPPRNLENTRVKLPGGLKLLSDNGQKPSVVAGRRRPHTAAASMYSEEEGLRKARPAKLFQADGLCQISPTRMSEPVVSHHQHYSLPMEAH